MVCESHVFQQTDCRIQFPCPSYVLLLEEILLVQKAIKGLFPSETFMAYPFCNSQVIETM